MCQEIKNRIKKIMLIGTGCGPGTLTAEAREAIGQADLLIGASRLLDPFRGIHVCREAVTAEGIRAEIEAAETEIFAGRTCIDLGAETANLTEMSEESDGETPGEVIEIAVLFSGDSGFWSGTRKLLPLLAEWKTEVIPGISSVQVLAARLGRPWQDWKLVSAHGRDCDVLREICCGRPVCFLTGGTLGPAEICRQLTEAGLGELSVAVGENLGYGEAEKLTVGTAAELAERTFATLSVLLTDSAPTVRRSSGIPDEEFLRREKIPMTKQEIRAAVLAKLALAPSDVCWDIGAGTGSVSVEMAMQAAAVYGVERNPEALEAAQENRRRFGAWNLRLIGGDAPEALNGLPAPDAVFIGGSGGNLAATLDCVHAANPKARICISAILAETMAEALEKLDELGYDAEITQIAVTRSRKVGGKHMMLAQNPVWLVTGRTSRERNRET